MRRSRLGGPSEPRWRWDPANRVLQIWNGSAWCTITPQSASVATEETHSSASFGDLATSGPAVTLDTGTSALVTISCTAKHSGLGVLIRMGWAVSGATTLAASDTYAAAVTSPVAGYYFQMSRTVLYSSLTAGSNTFTAKYYGGSATASFLRRDITVVAIP